MTFTPNAVNWYGNTLTITDEPYIMQCTSNVGEIEMYNAPAVDDQGNKYIVYWDLKPFEQGNYKPTSAARQGGWY